MENKKQVWKYVIMVVATGIIVFLLRENYNRNLPPERGYESLEAAVRQLDFNVGVPDMVLYDEGEQTYEVLGGQLLTVTGTGYEFRVGETPEEWADVMTIDEPSETSKRFNVDSDYIKKLRYRTGYDDGYSVLNWYTDDLMYGLRFSDEKSFEECLDILNLNEKSLEELDEESFRSGDSSNNGEESVNYHIVTSSSGETSLIVPDTLGVTQVASEEDVILNIGSITVLYATTSESVPEGIGDIYEMVEADNGVRVYTLSENPFTVGSENYSSFESFMGNLDIARNAV